MSNKLWCLGCAHYGEHAQDKEELSKYRGWAKRNNIDIAILGDALDTGICIGTKHIGSVWNNDLSPQEQIDSFVSDFRPLSKQIIKVISGNHERRIQSTTSLQTLKIVADQLGVPYAGNSSVFVWNGKRIFVSHGASSGYLTDFKKVLDSYENLDVVIIAHSHKLYAEPIRRFYVNAVGAISERQIWLVRVGSFLKDAEYARESLHSPTQIGSAILEYDDETKKINVRLGL